LSTLERTPIFFFLGYKWTSRNVGSRVFHHIKRKRKRKRGWRLERRKKLLPFFLHPKLCFHLCSSLVFWSHARLSYFSWLKGYKSLQISKTIRSILSFLFILYDEYECFPTLIFYDCLVWLLKRTLSYYSNQSIAKFSIKTRVVILNL